MFFMDIYNFYGLCCMNHINQLVAKISQLITNWREMIAIESAPYFWS